MSSTPRLTDAVTAVRVLASPTLPWLVDRPFGRDGHELWFACRLWQSRGEDGEPTS